ncbi:hypothetical protein [Demequina pelophila]|uniref:hypothetical protein n=1 Tax=Demequina pelophila TaxID=1638984 RepID=UPI0007827D12|nr:hypothetical protein [Demequina pelophila]
MAGRRAATVTAVVALVATGMGAAYALHLWRATPERTPSGRCTVTLDDGSDAPATDSLAAAQADNAALVAAASSRLGLPARGATIGIATALQESSLINVDYGDRDSLGLFQQRPSQGWGTEEQVQDRHYASDAFYTALVRVEGWTDMEVTVAAQRVQRSAYPDAYATREASARLWASALRGYSGAMPVTCDLGEASGTTGAAFVARLDEDWGAGAYAARVVTTSTEETWLDVTGADATAADAFAAWAVAVAGPESVTAVVHGESTWARGGDEVAAPEGVTGVGVRLAGVPAG